MKKTDIVIIGAGISGAVLAERYASIGKSVLIIEKRGHIAGNCYDYYNEDGILVSKYGAHLFHTNHENVWEYVNRFSKWYPYEHRVLSRVDGKLVPIPVNITTVNELFNLNIQTEEEMQQWLDSVQVKNENPQNGEEAAKARVGEILYEKMFKHYTKKQWDKYPEELDASVTNRIPVRANFDDRYFSDKYQYLPEGGYTQMFEKILNHPNITIMLNTDYFAVRDQITHHEKLFYTGPVDRFFDFKFSLEEKLEYRSINFEFETLDQEYFQDAAVINYPAPDTGFTRVIEYKHMTKQQHPKTTISREYTVDVVSEEQEPYYPVPNPRNQAIYSQYKKEVDKLTNVYFVGRLANYKYFNMDEAFKNALELFKKLQAEDKQKQTAGLSTKSTKKKTPWLPRRNYEYPTPAASKYSGHEVYQPVYMKHKVDPENE
ncbi:MAG: UDP-galactopyranose mutase [bacterium]|nr:UDP-galactopyranose mutase [bacterium]